MPTPLNHEDLFVQRYGLMLGWSRKLTNHNQQMAEDLLHDVFVQFTLARPDLGAIQNIDGYLYRMLRNRHLSSIRRTARAPMEQLSSAEYDSAEIRMRATDPRDPLTVRDELRTIFRYACARKETSRAGSILILRFFLGYYPAEIVQVSRTSRQGVDSWLTIARNEARIYLEDPARLAFVTQGRRRATDEYGSDSQGDFLLELRGAIFRSNDGKCPSSPGLQEIYQRETGLGSEVLAHIVSCAGCLDTANSILGLPPLRDRYPADAIGRDTGPRDGAAGTGTAGPGRLKRYHSKSADVYEHSPAKLSISVNGFTVGTQSISSENSEVTLNVNLDERIGFVEVHSEQDILLLAMDVEPPPDGPPEQSSRIGLSNNRSLELAMSFVTAWPALKVKYRDPALGVAFESALAVPGVAETYQPVERPSSGSELAPPVETNEQISWRNTLLRLMHLVPDGF